MGEGVESTQVKKKIFSLLIKTRNFQRCLGVWLWQPWKFRNLAIFDQIFRTQPYRHISWKLYIKNFKFRSRSLWGQVVSQLHSRLFQRGTAVQTAPSRTPPLVKSRHLAASVDGPNITVISDSTDEPHQVISNKWIKSFSVYLVTSFRFFMCNFTQKIQIEKRGCILGLPYPARSQEKKGFSLWSDV